MAYRNYLLMLSIVVNAVALRMVPLQGLFCLPFWFGSNSNETQDIFALSSDHQYATQILSVDPLMIYLDNFLPPHEIQYLLELGQPLFKPSKVYTGSKEQGSIPPSYRTSNSCVLPGKDPIVSLVKQRALSMLGFVPSTGVEALQLVQYGPSELFGMHYDWFDDPPVEKSGERYNRVASFFLFLDANCTSGGTYFPRLPAPPEGVSEDRISTTVNRTGLVILPRSGNGIAWLNLKEDGTGDQRTLHAGLPVREGSKVGMNIWIKTEV